MNENKLKFISHAAMWIAALTGGICGAVLTIGGYLLEWGPGGGMVGPLWKILLPALLSISISTYIGELLVRKMAKILLVNHRQPLETSLKSFFIVLVGSMAAFVVSWEVAFAMGKMTGAIEGLEWVPALLYTPMMSFLYGLPVCLSIASLFAVFVYFYMRAGNQQLDQLL